MPWKNRDVQEDAMPRTGFLDRAERTLATLRTVAGMLALVGCFVLLSPGVRIVRADEAEKPAGPVAATEGVRVVPALRDGKIAVLPRFEDPTEEQRSGVLVLNTRGYNYGPERPTVHPELAPAGPASPASPEAEAAAP
jgi:hypothetical protein